MATGSYLSAPTLWASAVSDGLVSADVCPYPLTALSVTARLRERLAPPRMLFTGSPGLRENAEGLHIFLIYVSLKPLFNIISLLACRRSYGKPDLPSALFADPAGKLDRVATCSTCRKSLITSSD
jgi:hypothetical protein